MSEADRLHREFVDDLCQWRSLLRFREAVRVRKLFQRLVSGKQVLVVYDRRDFGVVNKVEPVEKESREGFFFVSAQDLYFFVSELAMGELGVVGTVFVILVFVILKVS